MIFDGEWYLTERNSESSLPHHCYIGGWRNFVRYFILVFLQNSCLVFSIYLWFQCDSQNVRMFEINVFRMWCIRTKDKHCIGLLVHEIHRRFRCQNLPSTHLKDSYSKNYHIIYTHQEALRNKYRIRKEWNRREQSSGIDRAIADLTRPKHGEYLCSAHIWYDGRVDLLSAIFFLHEWTIKWEFSLQVTYTWVCCCWITEWW